MEETLEEYKKKGIHVSKEEINLIKWICLRKLKMCNNSDDLLDLLMETELRNHVIRREITNISKVAMIEKIPEITID